MTRKRIEKIILPPFQRLDVDDRLRNALSAALGPFELADSIQEANDLAFADESTRINELKSVVTNGTAEIFITPGVWCPTYLSAIVNLNFAPFARDIANGLQTLDEFPRIEGLNDVQISQVSEKFKSLNGVLYNGMPYWVAKTESDVFKSIAQLNELILSFISSDGITHRYDGYLKQADESIENVVSASQSVFNRENFNHSNNENSRRLLVEFHFMRDLPSADLKFSSYNQAIDSFFELPAPPTVQIGKSRRQWVLSVIAELYPEKASDATFRAVLESIFD